MSVRAARPWWKDCVAYQIYPRSFQDSDGDGVGDIRGIISRLPYLQSLGVGLLWLCPMYESPNDDNGYDISDYRSVAREFGTLGDLDELIARACGVGIRVILDLVVNHTSDEHPWFVESRASKDSARRDWYIWKPGRATGEPPTDYPSIFWGPAWERDPLTGEWYFHTFSRRQPDLNWENSALRDSIFGMMEWWAERGIAGFRVDAITFIKKNPAWPLSIAEPPHLPCNEPGFLDILAEMRDRVLEPRDMVTVAEAPKVTPRGLDAYVGEDRGVFSMIFTFEHVDIDARADRKWHWEPWTLTEWKRTFSVWQEAINESGWLSIYLENHDQVRSVSKFGDDGPEFSAASAKTLAAWYFLMRGTPFIYQGQEIGMPNCRFGDISEYRDVASLNAWREARAAGMSEREILAWLARRSRDNSRTPMHWDGVSPSAGFTAGGVEPWIRMNQGWREVNVAAQDTDPASVLNFYRALSRLRASEPALRDGTWEEIFRGSEELGGYRRRLGDRAITVACNFTGHPVSHSGFADRLEGRVLLDSAGKLPPGAMFGGETLGPWQAVVLG